MALEEKVLGRLLHATTLAPAHQESLYKFRFADCGVAKQNNLEGMFSLSIYTRGGWKVRRLLHGGYGRRHLTKRTACACW